MGPGAVFQIFRNPIKFENYILIATLVIILFHQFTARCLGI